MNRSVYVILVLLGTAGCVAFETIQEDYLNTKDYEPGMVEEAVQDLRTDYLYMEPSDKGVVTKYIFLAQNELKNSQFRDDYQVLSGKVDYLLGLPEAHHYIFVIFEPVAEKPEIQATQYLVVFDRMTERMVHAGVFQAPAGDPFYRYYQIFKQIQSE